MPDQFDYIARTYGRRFTTGMRVLAIGMPGIVTGATNHVMVKLEALPHSNPYHPTDVEEVKEETAT